MTDTTIDRTDAELIADIRSLIIASDKPVGISTVQRHLRIGYNRAARLLELAQDDGSAEPADPNTQTVEDPEAIEPGSAEHAQTFMVGKLMEVCKRRFMHLAEPWSKLSQREQERVLEGLFGDVKDAVRDAVKIIAANARVTFRAEVAGVNFKSATDVEAKLKLVNSAETHALADVAGGFVTIVIEQLDELLAIPDDALAGEPDNKTLFDESTLGTALDVKPEAVEG